MNISKVLVGSLVIGLAAPSLGCNTAPTDEDYDDVAQAVGALVANDSGGEVGSMEDASELSRGDTPEGFTASGEGSYEGKRLGLHYEYTLRCFDETGAEQSACDDTTDVANLVVSWGGELTLPRYQGSIARDGNWTLRDLQTDVARFEGQGSFEVHSELQTLSGGERSFHLTYDATYDDIRYSRPDRKFLGGTIRYDVHAERTRERGGRDVEVELDVEAVVTFEGDGTAKLVLDGERTYRVDLAKGTVEKS